MLTAAQIRAARGLLDWTREDLAREAGLSSRTIHNLEKGFISPRGTTASGLCHAFDKAGVIFPPEGGVRQERPEVKSIEGRDSVDVLFENLLYTVKVRGGEIIGTFSSQKAIWESFGLTPEAALDRLETLARYARIKMILSDLDSGAGPSAQGETRTVSRYCVGPNALLVCGNKYVMVQNVGQNDHRTIIINDPRVATASRGHFYDLWDIAAPIKFSAAKQVEEKQTAYANR